MWRTFARSYFGDYFSGGFFYLGGAMKFLAQWNEGDATRANVVSFAPPPSIRHFDEVAIDPLALVLSNQIYVLLTLRTRRDRRLAGACARDAGAADACAAPARARHGARLDGGDPARATPGCLGTIAI